MAMEFALLNASFETEATSRNFERELDVPLTEFDASTGELPDRYDFDAAVISGSGASVYWDDEWIAALAEWTDEAVDRGVPFLGVCFGCQLLAAVLGGRVEGKGARELGYHTIRHSETGPLFDGVSPEFVAFTTHADDVVELPPGASQLAENAYSMHAFQKEHVFGVQFHPEYEFEMAELTIERHADEVERTEDARETLTQENFEASREATLVFDNFVDWVAERA